MKHVRALSTYIPPKIQLYLRYICYKQKPLYSLVFTFIHEYQEKKRVHFMKEVDML